MEKLEKEFDYFVKQLPLLLGTHKGEFVAISGCEITGYFRSRVEAVEKTSIDHPLGTFIVQEVIEPEKSEMRFYSRVG